MCDVNKKLNYLIHRSTKFLKTRSIDELSKYLGITKQALYAQIGRGGLAIHHAINIQILTGGEINAEELSPRFFNCLKSKVIITPLKDTEHA